MFHPQIKIMCVSSRSLDIIVEYLHIVPHLKQIAHKSSFLILLLKYLYELNIWTPAVTKYLEN